LKLKGVTEKREEIEKGERTNIDVLPHSPFHSNADTFVRLQFISCEPVQIEEYNNKIKIKYDSYSSMGSLGPSLLIRLLVLPRRDFFQLITTRTVTQIAFFAPDMHH